jgi:hypothetical protein
MFKMLITVMSLLGASGSSAAESNFALGAGAAGSVKIGATVEDIYKVYSKDRTAEIDLQLEGMPSPAIQIFLSFEDLKKKKPAIVAELDNGKIYRLQIKSDKFHTGSGIRIGSTFGELRKETKDLKHIRGEEGYFGVSSQSLGMSFQVGSTPKGTDLYKEIPDKAKIGSILLFR